MEVDAGRIRAAAARPRQGRSDPRLHRPTQGVDAGRNLLMRKRSTVVAHSLLPLREKMDALKARPMRGPRRKARSIAALRAGPRIRRFAPPSPARGKGVA